MVKNVMATAYWDNPGPIEILIIFQVYISGKDPSMAPSSITVEYPGYEPQQVAGYLRRADY